MAAACGRAGWSLRADAALLRRAAALGGLELVPALRLTEVAEWAEEAERRIDALIATIRAWSDDGSHRWLVTDHGHPAYARPMAAVDAAHAARRALRDADPMERADLPTLLERWADNPVFASVLLGGLGASGVVDHLLAVDRQQGAGGERIPE